MNRSTTSDHGFVVHVRPYRDTSDLIEFFSLQHGRLGLLYKGSRGRQKGRQRIRPFCMLELQWGGRGELKNLYQASVLQDFMPDSDEAVFSAMYLNELLYALLPREVSEPVIWQCYKDSMAMLSRPVKNLDCQLRRFEFTLLNELGLLGDTSEDIDSNRVEPGAAYRLEAPGQWRRVAVEHNSVSGEVLLAIAASDYTDASLCARMKSAARQVLALNAPGAGEASRKLYREFLELRPG